VVKNGAKAANLRASDWATPLLQPPPAAIARLTATAVARLVVGLVSCCRSTWGLGPAGVGEGEPAVVTLGLGGHNSSSRQAASSSAQQQQEVSSCLACAGAAAHSEQLSCKQLPLAAVYSSVRVKDASSSEPLASWHVQVLLRAINNSPASNCYCC
jgi:hypothetical protein